MPIDEFGREIPAAGSGNGTLSGSNPFADPLRPDDRGRPRSHSRDIHNNNNHSSENNKPRGLGLEGELSARRDGRSRSPAGGGGRESSPRGGRGGGSPSPDGGGGRRREYDDNRRGGGGHHGRGRNHGRGGRSRADSSGYDDRRRGGGGGRRNRSRSYGDHDDRDDHHNGGHRHRDHGGRSSHRGSSATSQNRTKAHASERYAEQPMLCQFLWKKEMEEEQAKKLGLNAKPSGDGKNKTDADGDASMDESGDKDDNSKEGDNAEGAKEENKPPPLFESEEAENQAFEEYNAKYCINYVRTFFNHHLDDPWFRTRLSPLETYRQAQKERKRANGEANEIRKEILQSLEDMNSGVIPKKDPDCADHLGVAKCNFVGGCRLGVGTKPTNPHVQRDYHHHYHHNNNYYNENQNNQENETDMQHHVLQGEDRNKIERHAKSHLHSFIKSEACVKIMDVPSNVSDEQLLNTLAEYCVTSKEPPTGVWSDSVSVPIRDNSSTDPYSRTAYAVFPSSSAKDVCLEGLHKANEEANRHSSRNRRRKGDALPRILDLDVNCTDIYGRVEVDADGKGNAPPSSGKKKEENHKLPSKRCTVFVSTSHLASSQPVSVLSAALSSRERIKQDKHDITQISEMLDEVREIEGGSRLTDLLHMLYPGNELGSADDEDLLDISIAYLRRVHLFSFYNGCVAAKDVGNVLSFGHPAGTVHLRLRDADEILAKAAEEKKRHDALLAEEQAAAGVEKNDAEEEPQVRKDMLVTRLNDSIAKALEHANTLSAQGPSTLVSPEIDTAANCVQLAESNSRNVWAKNHGIYDEDGRARCSFHFCRKLFKDKAFLHKHLLKKHADQLKAERAKCHDGSMMTAWDEDERRPVPPILIDCGSKFGLVPSAVIGSHRPAASDPEPELWREEQGRMAEEERIRRERDAAIRAEEEEMQRRREVANAGEKRKSNFVDPDDMVEEKVELKFEDVAVVVPPPKKKKKKKKSLL